MIDTVIAYEILELRKLMFACIQKGRHEDPFLPIKIVTANNYQSAELKYFAALQGIDLLNITFLSFDLLVDQINGEKMSGHESDEIQDRLRELTHASKADRFLLMQEAIDETDLRYFQDAVKFSGFNAALQSTYNDLEEQGATSEECLLAFNAAGEDTVRGLNSDKFHDLFSIFSGYSRGLKEFRTAGSDGARAVSILKRNIKLAQNGDGDRSKDLQHTGRSFTGSHYALTMLYGFSELTAPQQMIVSLLGILTDVKFCMVMRDDPIFNVFKDKNSFLFQNDQKASTDGPDIVLNTDDHADDLRGPGLISQEIFKVEPSGALPRVEPGRLRNGRVTENSIMIFESPGPRHEVREIMRQIAHGIDKDKTGLTDIAVAYREDIYRTLLIENFKQLKIPFFIKDGVRLSESIAGRMLIEFLNACDDRWHRRELVSFLRYFQPKIDTGSFDLISRKAGIYEDLADLIKIIGNLGHDDITSDALRSDILEVLTELEEFTGRFRKASTFDQMAEIMGQVLAQIRERYLLDDGTAAVSADHKEADHSSEGWEANILPSDLDLYEMVIQELGKFGNSQKRSSELFSVKTIFRELIIESLNKNAAPIGTFLYSGVNLIPFESLRYLSFAHVYFPGMSYRSYPIKPSQDSILLDSEKSIFNGLNRSSGIDELGAGNTYLQLSSARSREEKALFALALSSVRERAVLSYASHDISLEKALLPSFYLLKVAEAVDGKVFDHSSLKSECSIFKKFGTDPGLSVETVYLGGDELAMAGLRPKLRVKAAISDLRISRIHQRREDLHRSKYLKGSEISYEGVFSDIEALKHMEKYILNERKEFSPTMLETFAHCPFKAFTEKILRLSVLEEPENIFEAEPISVGTMIHEILQKFMSANIDLLREFKVGIQRNSGNREDDGLDLLQASMTDIASTVFHKFERAGRLGNSFIWSFRKQDVMADLHKFVENECEKTGLLPKYFELKLEFGMKDLMVMAAEPVIEKDAITRVGHSDPFFAGGSQSEISLEKFRNIILKGRIDRIDKDEELHRFTVIDYKTGRALDTNEFSPNSVNGGRTLQIPLYFLFALQKFKQETDAIDINNSEAYYYYVTSKGDFSKIIFTGVDLSRHLQQLKQVVCLSVDLMSKGFFPAVSFSEKDKKCSYCDLRSICAGSGRQITPDEQDPRMQELVRLREVQ